MFKNEVIDRFAELKKNAQVSMYSLADKNIGHCVELTFFKTSYLFTNHSHSHWEQ